MRNEKSNWLFGDWLKAHKMNGNGNGQLHDGSFPITHLTIVVPTFFMSVMTAMILKTMNRLPSLKAQPTQGQSHGKKELEKRRSFHLAKVSCFGINPYLRQKFKVCNLTLLFWAVAPVDM
jgi:hypothetical protein